MPDIRATTIIEIIETSTEDHEGCLGKMFDWSHDRSLAEVSVILGTGFSAIVSLLVAYVSGDIAGDWMALFYLLLTLALLCIVAGAYHLFCLHRVHYEYRRALNLLSLVGTASEVIKALPTLASYL